MLSIVHVVVFLCTVLMSHAAYPPTTCDPLVPEYCTLPWPNDYWLLKDANGNPEHLVLTEQNLPIAVDGKTINPASWNILDGFSPVPAILAYWEDLNIDNCAKLWNISQSNNVNSPTIILNAKSNTRVAHWVELDHSSDNPITGYEENRTLMIWPSERLNDGELYIVALRYLKDNDGNLVTPSPGFIALRDNITTNDSSIEIRREYYNNFIFPTLEANGIDRNTLQLCWYFTTMSEQYHVQRMITMRDDAFSRIDWDNGGVQYTITNVESNPWSNIARSVRGQMRVPWYLNSRLPGMDVRIETEWDDPLQPVYQRHEEVEFLLIIPNSVANSSKESRFVQYGHGLFGSMQEITFGIFRKTANQYGYILGAVNWIGLSWEDVVFVTEMITFNFTNFPMVPDRCHQGMLNALFLTKLWLSSGFQKDLKVFGFNGSLVVQQPFYHHYYGNSQGGILGSVYMAVTTDVDRGVLGEPGTPYSLLLPRSVDFSTLFYDCKTRYRSDIERVFLFELIQLLWNSLEPAGYIGHINKNLLPSTPTHNVLIHYSLGDAQVTWLGAQIIARTLGCYMYSSQMPEYNETLYGYNWINDDKFIINVTDSNYNGVCLIQGWNYNVPQVPFVNLPPDSSYDTHDDTSAQSDAQLGNYRFFAEGILYNPCNGTCNGKR